MTLLADCGGQATGTDSRDRGCEKSRRAGIAPADECAPSQLSARYHTPMSWFSRVFRRNAASHAPDGDAPFPSDWQRTLIERVPIYHRLPSASRSELHRLIPQFVAEKDFWGSKELPVTEEMK